MPPHTRHRSIITLTALLITSCAGIATAQIPPIPEPPENPITEPKRVLGKILFWDEQLSSDNTMSCGTCHQPRTAKSDPRIAVNPGLDGVFGTPDDVFGSPGVVQQDEFGTPIPHPVFGTDRQVTSRSANPVSSAALVAPELFWDGRATSQFLNPETGLVSIAAGGALESQAVGPILSSVEMAHVGRTWDDVRDKLQGATPMSLATYLPTDMSDAIAINNTYPDLFNAAFGDPAITAERIGFAIATYERTLVPDQTPFDLGTMTPQQQQGFNVLNSPNSRCSVCHPAPHFSNNTFRNIGVRPIPEDTGRQGVTGLPQDAGRFKVPTLRNAGLKSTFMHNGRFSTLEEVMDFYIEVNGQMQFPQNIDPLIPPINVPPPQRAAVIEFMRNALTDPRVENEEFPFDRPILRSEQGDHDRDGDVDGDDFTEIELCFNGTVGGPAASGCERVDMDGDGLMTCDDWTAFESAWTDTDPIPEFPLCAVGPTVPTVSEWGVVIMTLMMLAAGTCILRRNNAILGMS